jgi:hypothetical protein
MSKITAFSKIFRDWEGLLGACDKSADLLPGADPLKGSVGSLLTQLKDLKVRQEDLIGQRKALTQSLTKVLADGRDAARKLRDFVRVQLGARSEQLTQFGISPLRPKKAKATAQAKKPAPAPPPAVAPPATGTHAPAAAGAMETGAPQNPTAP